MGWSDIYFAPPLHVGVRESKKDWRNVHNKELHDLSSSPNAFRM
jgi:hypothetical protein